MLEFAITIEVIRLPEFRWYFEKGVDARENTCHLVTNNLRFEEASVSGWEIGVKSKASSSLVSH